MKPLSLRAASAVLALFLLVFAGVASAPAPEIEARGRAAEVDTNLKDADGRPLSNAAAGRLISTIIDYGPLVRRQPAFGRYADDYLLNNARFWGTASKATLQTLLADPLAQRLDMARWKLTEPPRLKDVEDVVALLHRPLQGQLELATFFDTTAMGDAGRKIQGSWRGSSTLLPSGDELLKQFLKARRGQTVFVVGHVENSDFLMKTTSGAELRVPIDSLQINAQYADVMLFPIGCKTADAGAPAGHIANVTSDQIATFLAELPRQPTVADALAGLQKMGPMRFRLRGLVNQFEIEVDDPQGEGQIIHLKIPHAGPPSLYTFDPQSTLVPSMDPPWPPVVGNTIFGLIIGLGTLGLVVAVIRNVKD